MFHELHFWGVVKSSHEIPTTNSQSQRDNQSVIQFLCDLIYSLNKTLLTVLYVIYKWILFAFLLWLHYYNEVTVYVLHGIVFEVEVVMKFNSFKI